MECEICGQKIRGPALHVQVEGAVVTTCEDCARYGRLVPVPPKRKAPKQKVRKASRPKPPEKALIENIGELVRTRRTELGYTPKQFAKLIAEKISTIHHIESNSLKPNDHLTRKLERVLGVSLREDQAVGIDDDKYLSKSGKSATTLGDIVQIRSRKHD